MGNTVSYVDPKHATMWNNLCTLSNNTSRHLMLEKILVHPEYATAAKYAGIYPQLVDWKSKYERGFNPIWNFEQIKTAASAPTAPVVARSTGPSVGGAGVISHTSHTPTTFSHEIDRPRVMLKSEPTHTMKREEPVTLNPKALNMSVFNKLFEENRTADEDVDHGYGDWLKDSSESSNTYKGTVTKDNFNSVFAEQTKARRSDSKSFVPEALYMHTFSGSELGRNNAGNYTKASYDGGAGGLGYTDLRYAYGDGATFSQEVEGTTIATKSFSELEAERAIAPAPLSTHEQSYIDSMEKMRAQAEDDRKKRLTTYDSSAEARHAALLSRVNIRTA
jgi:hypothetical protein